MLFSSEVSIRIMIFVLGLCGFMVARYIHNHKIKKTPLICPVRFDCQTVVHSDYSKFFGVPVELAGMIYYAFISLSYILFIFIYSDMPFMLASFLMAVSFFAFLFSIYLLVVQIFVLKKGCSWCIASTIICLSIFILLLI